METRALDFDATLAQLRGFAGDWVDIHVGAADGGPQIAVFLKGRLTLEEDHPAPELGMFFFAVEESDEIEQRRRGSVALVLARDEFDRGELVVESGVLWVFQGPVSYCIGLWREESPGDRRAKLARMLAAADPSSRELVEQLFPGLLPREHE